MFRRYLQYQDRVLTFFEDWTLFVTVLGALVGLFVTVATRYTITYTMTWPEEFVRQVIMYTTFIGCATAVKNRALIRVDALPNLFRPLAKPLDFLNHLGVLCFSTFSIYYGIKMVAHQATMQQVTTVMKIPQKYLYCTLPLMGVLMLLRLAQVVYEDLTGQRVNPPKE